MQSKAADVPTYIAEAPAERRPCLTRLRDLFRKAVKGATEGMAYGMPTYTRDGTIVAGFASQKQYIAIYAGQKAVDAHRDALKGANLGKGCVRYANPAKVDFDAVKALLASAVGCD